MDKRSRAERLKETRASSLLHELRTGALSVEAFSHFFLEALSSNIQLASDLAKGLKAIKELPPEDNAHRFRLLGVFYEISSEHRKAITWSGKAFDLFRKLSHPAQSQCVLTLMTSHGHLGNYSMARYFAGQALAIPNLPPKDRLKIHANLAGLAYRVHDYATSRDQYQRALALDSNVLSEIMRGVIMYNLGVVLTSLNQFAEAEALFLPAIELFLQHNQTLYYGHALQSLGHLYTILGQYFHAEEKLRSARDIYLESGDSLGAALCDVELIRLDARLNRFDRILERIPILTKSFQKQGRSSELGLLFYHGIYPAILLREFLLAAEYLRKATRIFSKEKNQIYLANCTMLMGVSLWQQGRKDKGLLKITAASTAFAKLNLAEMELECLIYIYHIRNRNDLSLLLRVQTLLGSRLSPAIRSQGLILLSEYWRERGMLKRSVDALFEAVNLVEESRASISNISLRASFFQDKVEIYELLIERLLEWGGPKTSHYIFQAMELSRSRQMMDLLSRRESLPPILNREEPRVLDLQRLDLRLKQLHRKQEQIFSDASTAREEKTALLKAINDTRREITQVRREMRHENRMSLFFPLEFRPDQIRKRMHPGQLLVLFFLGKKMLYRIELTKSSLHTYHHPLPELFKKDFERALHIIANRITPKTQEALALFDSFNHMMVPRALQGTKHITFILHKALQRFPLALLHHPDGRLLLETHTINQAPNLPVFYFTQQDPNQAFNKPLLFFSDLEEDPSAQERAQLHNLFPDALQLKSLADPRVTEALQTSDFIHFAGHCVFDRYNPDRSYLQLGGARLELKAFAEIGFHNHPFLNLATCQSGWIAVSSGNEPHGFVIGSFAAGASALLAALWEVDDVATSYWMDVFYASLGLGLPGAFRKACLETKARFDEPYLWSGFALMGGS